MYIFLIKIYVKPRKLHNDKAKTSYWLKINTDINNLTNGLETYINESKDKEYTKAAQDILDNSKIIDDDEGR